MVAGIGVRVEGLNETVRALQRAGVEVADLKAVFSEIAAEGARLAAGFTPHRTGALARSVRGNKAKNKSVIMAGNARVKYAGAINYGWKKRNIKPALFMQRTGGKIEPLAVTMLEAGLDDMIERIGLGGD
jgi:hypothetical protein